MEYSVGTHVFGDWEIISEIGEGSYGNVYELQKTNFGVTAKSALKVIRVPRSVSELKEALSEGMDEKSVTTYFEGIVEQFVHEIAVMSELKSHPNIVSCEDYVVIPHEGSIGWDILIRMELLCSLSDYQNTHTLDEASVRKLACDICKALIFCQKKGLIHRDIKPGNIFVDSNGNFKLGDFGVARTAEKTVGAMSKQGTENYMAPEVYLGNPYGASADIYSLGIMLYRLMNSNRLPFYPMPPEPIRLSDRENALIRRMKGEEFPFPASASEAFTHIILKACAYNSSERYRTAAEMLTALGDEEKTTLGNAPEQENNFTYEEKTFSPFGSFSAKDEGSDTGDGTYSSISSFPENESPRGDVRDKTFSPFGQTYTQTQNSFEKDIFENDKEDILSFWKTNLSSVWAPDKKDVRWKTYFTPQIPLQICSNAIFNIAKNSIVKSDILAILDCSDDISAPCSSGVLITADKIYLQLGMGLISGVRHPEANVGIIDIKTFNSFSTEEKRLLFGKYKILNWKTEDSTAHSYTSHASYKIRYEILMKLIIQLRELIN